MTLNTLSTLPVAFFATEMTLNMSYTVYEYLSFLSLNVPKWCLKRKTVSSYFCFFKWIFKLWKVWILLWPFNPYLSFIELSVPLLPLPSPSPCSSVAHHLHARKYSSHWLHVTCTPLKLLFRHFPPMVPFPLSLHNSMPRHTAASAPSFRPCMCE